ncbi:MAG: hypothetical protein LBP93_06785 [Treponema sp.]|jgi:hypothetical protein|nr:hypothetical protein [Treponema sp.]
MKSLARLVLFFSLCFVIVFVLAAAAGFLKNLLDAARTIPAGSAQTLPEFAATAQGLIPFVVYFSILLSLSFTARRGIPIPLIIPCLWVLAVLFTLALSLGGLHARNLINAPPAGLHRTLGAPGLILSQGDTVMVVLGDPADILSSRVVSIPGRPLIYQEVPSGPNNTILALPPAPFRNGGAYSFNSLSVDFSLAAGQFDARLRAGLIPFGLYAGALILLLVSLRFVLDLSSWPLANLFLGAVVFRGVLALETFIDSREVQQLLLAFLGPWASGVSLSPLIFCGLGALIILYTLLVYLARPKRRRAG